MCKIICVIGGSQIKYITMEQLKIWDFPEGLHNPHGAAVLVTDPMKEIFALEGKIISEKQWNIKRWKYLLPHLKRKF